MDEDNKDTKNEYNSGQESKNSSMEYRKDNEITDTMIACEKEKEIRFGRAFKIILGISIFLTGALTLSGIGDTYHSIRVRIWIFESINYFLVELLLYISSLICLIALISIAVIKRPFSKILVWCITALGIMFVTCSFIYPRIPGYVTTGFNIWSTGSFTLIDGFYLMIGLLGILFARIIHYGFIYQKDADMTV